MDNELFILWTDDNIITTEKMVFMYAQNAVLKKWFGSVTLIIWGATAQLVTDNNEIGKKIEELIIRGVKVSACKACADQLGVSDKLKNLGVELKYWGEDLTRLIREKKNLITV
ncbi:MAG: DsrE family protein [Spirochaetia bacterium]|nr:DsrE family protein [Spirochaetia bacterium]